MNNNKYILLETEIRVEYELYSGTVRYVYNTIVASDNSPEPLQEVLKKMTCETLNRGLYNKYFYRDDRCVTLTNGGSYTKVLEVLKV